MRSRLAGQCTDGGVSENESTAEFVRQRGYSCEILDGVFNTPCPDAAVEDAGGEQVSSETKMSVSYVSCAQGTVDVHTVGPISLAMSLSLDSRTSCRRLCWQLRMRNESEVAALCASAKVWMSATAANVSIRIWMTMVDGVSLG